MAAAQSSEPMRGVGVIDPACGSGALLVHAARHILSSDVVRALDLPDAAKSDVVASLVVGLDIHPVAVEIAKASLMAALVTAPTEGVEAIQIHWGDALQGDPVVRLGEDRLHLEHHGLPGLSEALHPDASAPSVLRIKDSGLPMSDADLYRWARDAARGAGKPRGQSAVGEDSPEATSSDERSGALIPAEVHEAWRYRIMAALNAREISRRGFDRVIANPPWVRMNLLPDGDYKASIEALARISGLWGIGNSNSAFNLAALFVSRCQSLYVSPSPGQGFRAAWILPAGAMTTDVWRKARRSAEGTYNLYWDLTGVKPRPFPGITSCVWFQSSAPESAHGHTVVHGLRNAPGSPPPLPHHSWDEVQDRLVLEDADVSVPLLNKPPSVYGLLVSIGASLYPRNLVRVAAERPVSVSRSWVRTQPAMHDPWKAVPPLDGVVPKAWMHAAALATQLIPFRIEPATVLLPLNDDGTLDADNMERSDYWGRAEALWREHGGSGDATPRTLWDRLDHHKRASTQVSPENRTRHKVLFNAAGEYLRSARTHEGLIADNSTYYLLADTADEAAYLVAALNSTPMQAHFQNIRSSDRHCTIGAWRTLPVPRMDYGSAIHRGLVRFCEVAEGLSGEAAASYGDQWADWPQSKRSALVREAFRRDGVQDQIDALSTALMDTSAIHCATPSENSDTPGQLSFALASTGGH